MFEVIGSYTGPKGIRHIHSVGRAGWEKYSTIAKERGFDKYTNIKISEYIYDMQLHLAAADIVIGRAGAMTLAENACMGKASILIPSPNVTGDHQFKNAKVLADAGAAIVYRESELDGAALTAAVRRLAEDEKARREMEARVRAFAKPFADREIALAAIEIAKRAK